MEYLDIFNGFVSNYNDNIADPRLAGEVLAKLSQYFATYNSAMVASERRLSLVARDIELRLDEATGKPISSARAKILVEATDEMFEYNTAKAHVQNIEQFINSLKTIAKLITNEYHVMGNI